MNYISDHLPNFVISNLHTTYPNRCVRKKYVKTRTEHTITLLIENVSEESWESVLNSKEVNAAYNEYIKIFTKLYDTCCPVKTVTRSTKFRDKPCITSGGKKACLRKIDCTRYSITLERAHLK